MLCFHPFHVRVFKSWYFSVKAMCWWHTCPGRWQTLLISDTGSKAGSSLPWHPDAGAERNAVSLEMKDPCRVTFSLPDVLLCTCCQAMRCEPASRAAPEERARWHPLGCRALLGTGQRFQGQAAGTRARPILPLDALRPSHPSPTVCCPLWKRWARSPATWVPAEAEREVLKR